MKTTLHPAVPTPTGAPPGRPVAVGLYLLHLAVPLFVVVDVRLTLRFLPGSKLDFAVLALTSAWFVLGLGALLLSSTRRKLFRILPQLLLSIYVLYFGLFGLELLVRHLLRNATVGVFYPNTKTLVKTNPVTMPGLHGVKHYSINSIGLRGPEPPKDSRTYRIVTIGGSTTECYHLDDSEAWPELLMQHLNRAGEHVWVNNAGVSGHTSVHHLAVLRGIPAVQNADAYVFLLGVNDLQRALRAHGGPTQGELEQESKDYLTAMRLEGADRPYFKRTLLYSAIRAIIVHLRTSDPGESRYAQRRGMRQSRPTLPLPDLRIGLREYRSRIGALDDECRRRKVRCVFLTQPMMLRENMTPEESKLLWFGWIGPMENPEGYGSIHELLGAIDRYNGALLVVCKERQMECYDLASAVPKDTSAFFDDCHFNENGSRLVAEYIAERLLERRPLRR